MPATQTKPTGEMFDAQVREAGEQALAAARQAGNLYLDWNEQVVDRTIDFEVKLAGMTQQAWLKSLIDAQADVSREIAGSYTKVVRGILK